ncbi:uncharacterized protein LOC144114187 isoform X1 [Amblyomma americanum]
MAIRRHALSIPQTGPVFCRLCLKGREIDALMVACLCTGDNTFVHKSCIERSVTQSGVTSCEFCGYRLRIRRVSKPLLQWLVSVESREDVVLLLLNLVASTGDVLAFTLAWLRALTYLEQEQGAPRAAHLFVSGFLSCLTCFWSWFQGYRLCSMKEKESSMKESSIDAINFTQQLLQLDDQKATGPDGIPTGFLKRYFTDPIRRWRRDTSTLCVLSVTVGRRGALERHSKETEIGSLGQLACDSHGDEQCLTGSQSRQVLS